jgi:hypothetical protein
MSANLYALNAVGLQYGMKHYVVEEVYDYQWRLINAHKRLAESKSIADEDRETISRFVQHLKAQGVSTGRLAKYTYHLKNALEHLGTSIQLAKREDMTNPLTSLPSNRRLKTPPTMRARY